MDLSQPCILCPPRVVHRGRPLRDGVQGEVLQASQVGQALALEGRVPQRQRVKGFQYALAHVLGRHAVAMPLGGALKLGERL